MRLVAIGGVAAGMSAAARARRLDPGLEILVLEKGDTISYGACGLPYYIDGRVRNANDLIVYTPEYFRKERNITVRTGAEVASIEHARREVSLKGGERVHYDRLVIATGARPKSSIPGCDQPHVFRLHTFADGVRLKAFLAEKHPKRAVVIGAGYIGLEAADALRRNGLSVTLIDSSDHLMNRDDPVLSASVVKHLQRHGVDVRLGTRVASVDEIPADLVLLASGLQPNAELAFDAGIQAAKHLVRNGPGHPSQCGQMVWRLRVG